MADNVTMENTQETVDTAKQETGKKEKKMKKAKKHINMAKAGAKLWAGTKWVAKGALKIGAGIALGVGIVKTFSKPQYVELRLNQQDAPQIDAVEGVDFHPAQDEAVG